MKFLWFPLIDQFPSLPIDICMIVLDAYKKNEHEKAATKAKNAMENMTPADRVALNMLYAQMCMEALQLETYAMETQEKIAMQAGVNKIREMKIFPTLGQE